MVQWDENKRLATLAARGLDFADAEKALREGLIYERQKLINGENRRLAYAFFQGLIVFVVYQRRGDDNRIISMRCAGQRERKAIALRLSRLQRLVQSRKD